MDEEQPNPPTPSLGQRLSAIEDRIERLAHRLEEAIAYFALRSNRVADSQSVYLGDNVAVTFLEDGTRILVDTKSLDIGIHLLTLGRWEPAYTALFARLVRPGDTVLDLGANIGVYTLLASRLVGPGGRVHAFEPNPRLAQLVNLSIRMNGFAPRAQVHRVAASDRTGVARLFFTDSYSGGGSLTGTEEQRDATGETKHAVDCRLVPLDTLFTDPAMKVDVIKMDVEGHEGPALRGMRQLLARSPDVRIMMEFGPQMMQGSGMGAAEVVALLESLGLSAWTIDAGGGVAPVDWPVLAGLTAGLQNILVARQAPV
jgi:FkbM family methyltransferase